MNDFLSIKDTLISDGVIPEDSRVISTHNNLIVSSSTDGCVMRIARISSMEERSDPGDLRYSHQASWLIGESGSVLRPVSEMPITSRGLVVSEFPFKEPVRWHVQDPSCVLSAINRFGRSLSIVDSVMELRKLDIEGYARERLEQAVETQSNCEVLPWAKQMLDFYKQNYAVDELTRLDPALVHGDLHAGNVVDPFLFIDLDSVAIGPRLYDLASWRVRSYLGDIAPMEEVVKCARHEADWNEEMFLKLVGWKLLSSITHVLRYGDSKEAFPTLSRLDACGLALEAPGPWGQLKGVN